MAKTSCRDYLKYRVNTLGLLCLWQCFCIIWYCWAILETLQLIVVAYGFPMGPVLDSKMLQFRITKKISKWENKEQFDNTWWASANPALNLF